MITGIGILFCAYRKPRVYLWMNANSKITALAVCNFGQRLSVVTSKYPGHIYFYQFKNKRLINALFFVYFFTYHPLHLIESFIAKPPMGGPSATPVRFKQSGQQRAYH